MNRLLQRWRTSRLISVSGLLLSISLGVAISLKRQAAPHPLPEGTTGSALAAEVPSATAEWRDSLGDGFPDGARLASAEDRQNFVRWLTFLSEVQFYSPTKMAEPEILDCAALIRFACRNALMAHTVHWRREMGLPVDPGFGDLAKFNYPRWPLGERLFRTRPGPLEPQDAANGAFAEFADSRTLLQYNTFPISRDLRAARAGDLLFFRQATQREPYHTMLFVGNSYFQPAGADWIVYHTGDLEGHRGEIREVRAGQLLQHPDLRWRPTVENPRFLGVYRFEILR